jgi:hypothetical protein
MLPVSLDYLRPVFCEPNFASVSRLASSCVLLTQCCQCLWIIFVLCFVNPMLPVTLDYFRLVFCEPNVDWQHWVHKTQDEDNPETLATLDSQNTGRR